MPNSPLNKLESHKREQFKQNELLNTLLDELKVLLQPVQKEINHKFYDTKWPIGFIVGNARSGTTLLTQWLASLKIFSYPTNFLTRFAYAPYIGAMIQKMIFDNKYDFHGDFSDIQSGLNFNSDLGKSKGALAVNEFQHFFRNYVKDIDSGYLDNEALKLVDFAGMKKGLASIESVFNKPFITKAAILKYNINILSKEFKNSFFYYIKREPIFNMQSLLLARHRYYRSDKIWYGSKPKEYDSLKDMDIYHQIAGQVYFSNKHIQKELKKIHSKKYILIEYEKFCSEPEDYYQQICDKYRCFGYEINENYKGSTKFKVSNKLRLDKDQINKFDKAYKYFDK